MDGKVTNDKELVMQAYRFQVNKVNNSNPLEKVAKDNSTWPPIFTSFQLASGASLNCLIQYVLNWFIAQRTNKANPSGCLELKFIANPFRFARFPPGHVCSYKASMERLNWPWIELKRFGDYYLHNIRTARRWIFVTIWQFWPNGSHETPQSWMN